METQPTERDRNLFEEADEEQRQLDERGDNAGYEDKPGKGEDEHGEDPSH